MCLHCKGACRRLVTGQVRYIPESIVWSVEGVNEECGCIVCCMGVQAELGHGLVIVNVEARFTSSLICWSCQCSACCMVQ